MKNPVKANPNGFTPNVRLCPDPGKLIARTAEAAKFHDTHAIQHYAGHKSIRHTVRYTELSAAWFRNFWED